MDDRRVILETDRLQLREMGMSDLAALSVMLQDEKVMYAYNGAFNDEETVAWMQKQLRRYGEYGFGLWGMFDRVSDEMIGQCGITMQEYKAMLVTRLAICLPISIGIKVTLRKRPWPAGSMDLRNCILKLYIPLSAILTWLPKMWRFVMG